MKVIQCDGSVRPTQRCGGKAGETRRGTGGNCKQIPMISYGADVLVLEGRMVQRRVDRDRWRVE